MTIDFGLVKSKKTGVWEDSETSFGGWPGGWIRLTIPRSLANEEQPDGCQMLPLRRWVYPLLLGIIDDHSRLCCHAQWYLAEAAEELDHALCQALQKRVKAKFWE